MRVAALFVETGGGYFGLPDVDPWDRDRDARLYAGPWPVVAHPPCQRWGKLWAGQPLHIKRTGERKVKGDDATAREPGMKNEEIIERLAKVQLGSMLDADKELWPVIGPNGAVIGLAVSRGKMVRPLYGPMEAPLGNEEATVVHMETMECDPYEECWNIKAERGVLFYAWELTQERRRGLEKAAHESGRVVRRTKTWARLISEEIVSLYELQDKIRAALRSLGGE